MRLPASSSKNSTHQGVVLAVPDDPRNGDPVGAGIPNAPGGVVVDDALDEVVKGVTVAIGTAKFRIVVLFTVFCTKSAVVFSPEAQRFLVVPDGLHPPGTMTGNYWVDGGISLTLSGAVRGRLHGKGAV